MVALLRLVTLLLRVWLAPDTVGHREVAKQVVKCLELLSDARLSLVVGFLLTAVSAFVGRKVAIWKGL